MDSTDDHLLAARIAAACGQALVALRREAGAGGGEGPRRLGAEGDRRSHELIAAALGRERPGDPVLSEEGAPPVTGGDGAPARLWIVDPLDGTREYGEGRADFAVHVALALGGEAVVGAVALPAEEVVLSTGDADRPPPAPAPGAPLRIAVSRTRPPVEAHHLAAVLGAELVPMGSAGAKTMAVVRGEVDAYVHAGGQYEWDSAAPVAVARAYGVHASRLDGSPLRYGRPDPWLPDLVVCRRQLVQDIGAALGW